MDDIPDPQRVDPLKVVEMQNASGNYIVLDLGDGKYGFYEHLKAEWRGGSLYFPEIQEGRDLSLCGTI